MREVFSLNAFEVMVFGKANTNILFGIVLGGIEPSYVGLLVWVLLNQW